ncbi:hypothetical protein scyTo_0007775, partial [Scyliorhinus torazame]|nr:hypothetical protein [Scyliorhinus torazame]
TSECRQLKRVETSPQQLLVEGCVCVGVGERSWNRERLPFLLDCQPGRKLIFMGKS